MVAIITGIIINTFQDLSSDNVSKEEDKENICFICSINRQIFERHRIKFSRHIEIDHNPWNYLVSEIEMATIHENAIGSPCSRVYTLTWNHFRVVVILSDLLFRWVIRCNLKCFKKFISFSINTPMFGVSSTPYNRYNPPVTISYKIAWRTVITTFCILCFGWSNNIW